jgi:hypothetical protein
LAPAQVRVKQNYGTGGVREEKRKTTSRHAPPPARLQRKLAMMETRALVES